MYDYYYLYAFVFLNFVLFSYIVVYLFNKPLYCILIYVIIVMFVEIFWLAMKRNWSKETISGSEQLGTIVSRQFVSSVFLWRTGKRSSEKNTSLDVSFPAVLVFDLTEVVSGFIYCVVCPKHPQWQAFMSPRSPESMRRCCLNISVDQSASLDAWKRYRLIIHFYTWPRIINIW